MKTIYSFVPVKKRMKILELINYHLQRHPSCELDRVVVSPQETHLVLYFCGIDDCLLIPLCPNQHQYYILYRNFETKDFFDLMDAFIELETLLIWRWTT